MQNVEHYCHKRSRGNDVTEKQMSLPSTVEHNEAQPPAEAWGDAIG